MGSKEERAPDSDTRKKQEDLKTFAAELFDGRIKEEQVEPEEYYTGMVYHKRMIHTVYTPAHAVKFIVGIFLVLVGIGMLSVPWDFVLIINFIPITGPILLAMLFIVPGVVLCISVINLD